MSRQIILTGLATAVLFTGCKLHKDEPVAQQKSIGRILDAAFQVKKRAGDLATHVARVRIGVENAISKGLREDQFRGVVESVVMGGSKGISEFKKAGIRKIYGDFIETSGEMAQRLHDKMNALPPAVKSELDVKFAVPGVDYTEAAAFLKKHTDIADDKIFARLVTKLGKNLDDFAEAVATNHRLADAVGVELAIDSSYGLKRMGISAEEMAAELKVSSNDFSIEEIVFNSATKNPMDGYKFVQALSGVDVYDEAHALDLLLRRGNDGKFAYEKPVSSVEFKKLGNPFDKRFNKPIISDDPKYASNHLRIFYKGD